MSSTSITTTDDKMKRRAAGKSSALPRRGLPAGRYPLARTAACFVEPWIGYAAAFVLALAAVARYFHFAGTTWLVAAPILIFVALAAVRFPRNRRRLKLKRQEFSEAALRAARYNALMDPAREAVDDLARERRSILEKVAASGQNLSPVLEKLEEYEKDFTDLLYLFQERSCRLKEIRGRDFEETRRALAEDRRRLEQAADKSSQTHRRMAAALDQQETLIRRQEQVASELDESLNLIRQQARNIQSMFRVVSDQIAAMPLGVNWSANFDEFETLSDSIQMTKEMLSATDNSF